MKKHTLFFIIYVFSLLFLSGCGQRTKETSPSEAPSPAIDAATAETSDSESVKGGDLVALYQKIYEETTQNNIPGNTSSENLEMIREIIEKLGAHGVTAIDTENQVDMVNPQQLNALTAALKSRETAELTVLVVSAYDRFTEYDLLAEKGTLEAVKTYYQYIDGTFENISRVSFPADSWQYTDEGYFIFTGKSSSVESLVLTMSDDAEITAWRAAPLDARFREWNRRYLLPVGYGRNNLVVGGTENPEQIEAFFAAYREHLDGQVTVFQVNDDKTLDALTFLHIPYPSAP